MTPQDFERKLKKLNPRLWIDHTKIAYPYSQDYPTCGLYFDCHIREDSPFIVGVPQLYVPEWTISGVDMKRMLKRKQYDEVRKLLETGLLPSDAESKDIKEKLLWRGYRSIVHKLVRDGYIDHINATKEFRFQITPQRYEFPRNFVQFNS